MNIQYVEASRGTPTVIDAELNLTANITGLTNGTEYQFSVRAVYLDNGSETNGPYSNSENATPLGLLAAPVFTGTAGDTEVILN